MSLKRLLPAVIFAAILSTPSQARMFAGARLQIGYLPDGAE